jgi:hypothetical protein
MGEPGFEPSGVEQAPVPCGHRDPEDDFYCLRYQVWYPSLDCAFRTRFRTSHGCLNCEQGRFNLRRHAASLHQVRLRVLGGDVRS